MKQRTTERVPKHAAARSGRRAFLQTSGALALAASPLAGIAADAAADADADDVVTFANGPRKLVAYPQKRPLIRVHTRPPHLETPFAVFDEGPITANDAFFVRYHLANIPLFVDTATYRLAVNGAVTRPLSLSLADLQALGPPVDVVAVNQCSGNSRGFSSPRVFGAQLGNGSMGNARWTGVPLRTVLEKAGVGAGADSSGKQVTFDGLDTPVLPTTPDFRKALALDHALSGEPLVAWGMNGEDLPVLNGFPVRLVVPGWFGTYWVKHLSTIEVIDQPFSGLDAAFMTTAYRVPDNECQCVAPGTAPAKTRPISALAVRSFVTNVARGQTLAAGRDTLVRGIAFDGGSGIRRVELSIDGGASWRDATLGRDLGRFSFRTWQGTVAFATRGAATVMVRATSVAGETQPTTATWNPSGYRRNVVESTSVTVA